MQLNISEVKNEIIINNLNKSYPDHLSFKFLNKCIYFRNYTHSQNMIYFTDMDINFKYQVR